MPDTVRLDSVDIIVIDPKFDSPAVDSVVGRLLFVSSVVPVRVVAV